MDPIDRHGSRQPGQASTRPHGARILVGTPAISSAHVLTAVTVLDDQLTDDCCPLEAFLDSLGLVEYAVVFTRERVTLESLFLLDEKDLQELKIPLGPRKLIIDALNRQRKDLEHISKQMDESTSQDSKSL
jgi:hypothetical protein